jgi:hypothetical protein
VQLKTIAGFLLGMWLTAVFAETSEKARLTTKMVFKDNVGVEVTVLSSGTLLDPVALQVVLSMPKDGGAASFQHVEVNPGPALINFFPKSATGSDKNVACEQRQFQIDHSKPFSLLCVLTPIQSWGTYWNGLFVRPGPQTYVVSIKRSASELETGMIRIDQSIAYSSIILASVFGAILFAVLELVIDARNRSFVKFGTFAEFQLRWFANARSMFLSALGGAIVSIIVLALTRSSTTIGLPVSVNIDSIWGGVLVGMGSLTIGRSIREKFGAAPAPKATSPEPAIVSDKAK